jgi:hypothetical protein
MQIGAGAERVAQLIGRRSQPHTRQCDDGGGIRFAIRHRAQHPARTRAQEIRHQTRELDVRFFEQTLKPVL